jgi:hypothetical protein
LYLLLNINLCGYHLTKEILKMADDTGLMQQDNSEGTTPGGVDVKGILRTMNMAGNAGNVSSVSGSYNVNNVPPLELAGILQQAANTMKAQQAVNDSALQTHLALTDATQKVLGAEVTNLQEGAAAAGNIAGTKTQAELDTIAKNQALQQAAGLTNDLGSTLTKSLNNISAASDDYMANMNKAREMAGTSLLLDGPIKWLDSMFVHTPERYEAKAAISKEILGEEAGKLEHMQQIFTGQAAVNAATAQTVTQASVADATKVAAQGMQLEATTAQVQAMAVGAKHTELVMNQSDQAISQALSYTTARLHAASIQSRENKFSIKLLSDPQQIAALNMAEVKRGNPPSWTPARIAAYRLTPVGKAQIEEGVRIGSTIFAYNQAAGDDGAAPPIDNLYGNTAGEAAFTLHNLGFNAAGVKDGTPVVQKFLADNMVGTAVDPMSKKSLNPKQQVAAIDSNITNTFGTIKTNTFDSDLYGKANMADINQMAIMKVPESQPFRDKVLTPLVTGNVKNPNFQMIIDAAKNSDLTNAQIVAGLMIMSKAMTRNLDATRKYTEAALPSARDVGTTGIATTGLFGRRQQFNLDNQADLTDKIYHMRAPFRDIQIPPFDKIAARNKQGAGN